MKDSTFKKNILLFAAFLFLWYLIYQIVNNEIVIASPYKVFFKICELFKAPSTWIKFSLTALRALSGFFLAICVAFFTSILTLRYKPIAYFFSPIIFVIKTTPVVCFIILTLVWIPSSFIPVFISFLSALPFLHNNIMQGIKSVDNKMIEMSKVFHFNLTKRIKMIYWPEMKPYFFSSAAISFGIAWKSGISAEVLSSTKNSIGMSLYFSQTHLDTTSLFAWTIIIIIISYSLEKLIIRR